MNQCFGYKKQIACAMFNSACTMLLLYSPSSDEYDGHIVHYYYSFSAGSKSKPITMMTSAILNREKHGYDTASSWSVLVGWRVGHRLLVKGKPLFYGDGSLEFGCCTVKQSAKMLSKFKSKGMEILLAVSKTAAWFDCMH